LQFCRLVAVRSDIASVFLITHPCRRLPSSKFPARRVLVENSRLGIGYQSDEETDRLIARAARRLVPTWNHGIQGERVCHLSYTNQTGVANVP
jgi:hypothetical protein